MEVKTSSQRKEQTDFGEVSGFHCTLKQTVASFQDLAQCTMPKQDSSVYSLRSFSGGLEYTKQYSRYAG